MTGAFTFTTFNGSTLVQGPITPTLSTDASGNQVLTASITNTPTGSESVNLNYTGDANYEPANAQVQINVILPDFTMTPNNSALTITAGQSGSEQLTVTPTTNIASSVALVCSLGVLAGATCTFNPAPPFTLSNNQGASTMVTISTMPPSASPTTTRLGIPRPGSRRILPPGWWLAGFADVLAILILYLLSRRRRHRLATRFGTICLLCLVLGCGTSSGGGGGNGGGGGGGNASVPTSLTFGTSALKQAAGTNVTFTATVKSTSTQPITGVVQFLDSGSVFDSASVVNGTAVLTYNGLVVGTHVISAQYSGDVNNQASRTSGAIDQVITGTAYVVISGSSAGNIHAAQINVTIQ
jgi:hypothetical protein